MNERLLEHLICPTCLPEELDLNYEVTEKHGGDITTGNLLCHSCGSLFPIIDGIAFLDPSGNDEIAKLEKYEQEEVVSSQLWTHYGDLLGENNCNDAYPLWSKEIQATSGVGVDLGGSVGRFTFEIAEKCDFAVGIDSSVALIRAARELMQSGYLTIPLKEEGKIRRKATIHLPRKWLDCDMAFIVADPQRVPIKKNTATIVSSMNLIDRISAPRQLLLEMNRVSQDKAAQMIISAPFSWSKAVAKPKEWLGGKQRGPYAGFGLNNIRTLLCTGMDHFSPTWKEEKRGQLWLRIRVHRNFFELLRSTYIKVKR